MNLITRLAAGLALSLFSVSSMADVIAINLFDGGANRAQGTAVFEEGGQSVSVTARDAVGGSSDVFIFGAAGVGAAAGPSDQLDQNETLVLDFSPEPVSFLRALTIDTDIGDFAVFELFADGVSVGVFDVDPGVDINFIGGISGDVFEIVSLTPDNFIVSRVVVDALAISAPGTLALLGLGWLGLAGARRRRA